MAKNLLTFAAIAALCAPAFAQQESANVPTLTAETEYANGTVVASSDNVTMTVAFGDTYKPVSLYGETDVCKAFSLNGGDTNNLGTGVQGKSKNPKGLNAEGSSTGVNLKVVPTEGAVFQLVAKADGYLYIKAKMNTTKETYVLNASDNYIVAYSVSAFGSDGTQYTYTLPANTEVGADVFVQVAETIVSTEAQAAYIASTKMATPAVCYKAATGNECPGSISGVIAFPVKANKTYQVYCAGSKLVASGFVFDKGATILGTIAKAEPTTAIKNITLDELDENAPVYNVLGQRVSKGHKGICIQNGKKFIVK